MLPYIAYMDPMGTEWKNHPVMVQSPTILPSDSLQQLQKPLLAMFFGDNFGEIFQGNHGKLFPSMSTYV